MCGIFGIWHIDDSPLKSEVLQRASEVQQHRGPDDEGYLLVNTCSDIHACCRGKDTTNLLPLPDIAQVDESPYDLGFSFRRLSILDLSPAGHQPMSNSDESLWIVFNGEIYNYTNLRNILVARGYQFRTATDTEVVLYAYEEWGPDCLQRFNGMWAFAVWDGRQRSLFCARDRFGIKPFYYYCNGRKFAFASEIKALLADPEIVRQPNLQRLYDFLAFGQLNSTQETLFQGIFQLPPASYLLLKKDNPPSIFNYWDIEPSTEVRSDQEWINQFRELLVDAVRIRLRSDVPIGSCLSGGIDSSSIVCIANQLLVSGIDLGTQIGKRQKTFSSFYDDPQIDERSFIDAVLDQTGADGHRIMPKGSELFDLLPRIIWHQDQPFGSTTIYSQWRVMQLARMNDLTVLLDGQGADEMLAGYPSYYPSFLAELIRRMDLTTLWNELQAFPYHLNLKASRTVLAATRRLLFHITRRNRLRNKGRRHSWIDDTLVYDLDVRVHDQRFHSVLDEYLYKSLKHSLIALLRYEDRNSMAFSIEARVPFLDYRLVELAFNSPLHLKVNRGTTKVVLREATRGIIPKSVTERQSKLGFPTPGDIWFRHELAQQTEQIFRSRTFEERGIIKPEKALTLLERHTNGSVKANKQLWRILCTEMWMRTFFDRSSPEIRP